MDDNQKSEPTLKLKSGSRTLKIALAGIIAGVYALSTVILSTLSFLQPNLRLSNMLIGIVPIVGWPAVAGITMGVFLANTVSPLGPIDLISAIPSFVGLTIIFILRKRSVLGGLAIYSVLLGVWVTTELWIVGYVRTSTLFDSFIVTTAFIAFVVVALGYLLYRALLASGLKKRLESRGLG